MMGSGICATGIMEIVIDVVVRMIMRGFEAMRRRLGRCLLNVTLAAKVWPCHAANRSRS